MFKTLVIIVGILALVLILILAAWREQRKASRAGMIKYVALGDSYTIGHGVAEVDTWPMLLTKHLQESGVDIELMVNPARSGWNSQDLIDRELPAFDRAEPDFVTLMIGTNDVAQGIEMATFRQNYSQILDHILSKQVKPHNLVVLTTPDYSITPTGASYGDPVQTLKSIEQLNAIIKEEATKRNLQVVDIFKISQSHQGKAEMIGDDGLHPSAAAYREWEAVIYPAALQSLKASP